MLRKQETEVLVVGAGPVGMFTALSLAERGVKVEIIDESWRTTARSYALALHSHSLELLDGVGLMDDLLDQGHRIDAVAFYEGEERRCELSMSDLPGGFPFLLVIPQDRLERSLSRRLKEKGVPVHWNRRLAGFEQHTSNSGRRVVSQVEELGKESVGYGVATSEWVVEERSRVVSDFLIGADGHRSAVRRLLGFDFDRAGAEGGEVYAVFEVQAEPPVASEVRVVLGEETTDVLWPLGPNRLRWSFQLLDPEGLVAQRSKGRLAVQLGGDVFPYLDRDDLARLVAERAAWSGDGHHATDDELTWSVAVRFERRLASRFGDGRVWLAGDAAHLTGPVGVQSMNIGLKEAHELAWRIAEVLHADGSEELFDDFDRQRHDEWKLLLGLDGAPPLVAGAAGWVERHAERLMPCLPASGDDLTLLARRLGLEV